MQDLDRAILLASLALDLIGSRSYSVIFRFGQAQVKFLSTPVQQHAWVHANSPKTEYQVGKTEQTFMKFIDVSLR